MKILSVKLHTTKIDAQRAFYTETLGFPLADDAGAGGFAVCAGETRLIFEPTTDDEPHIQHMAFNVPPCQFDAARAWIGERVPILTYNGQPFIDFSASSWQAKSVYFEDVAGNVLEFIARERLRTSAEPVPFAVESVMGVSEIGVASEDVPRLTARVRDELCLSVFDGDPTGTFCAFGDDHGLLLAVEAGRMWLPTDNRPAGVFPVEITLAGDADRTLELPPYTLRTEAV